MADPSALTDVLSAGELALVGAAAVAAGFVNAVAGGGTLISFPALTAVGVPALSANVTNTVALSPGYLGGVHAQRADLEGQGHRLRVLVPVGVVGGLVGGGLLLATGESLFRSLVPFLILAACGLLAAQDRIRAWVQRREEAAARAGRHGDVGVGGAAAVFVGAVYGGYFGAGLGIILLAVLGAVIDDQLRRINALKQAMSLTINTTAALFFVFSGRVVWAAAVVMMAGALLGGSVGGRVAARLRADVLRAVVITLGVVIAIAFWLR